MRPQLPLALAALALAAGAAHAAAAPDKALAGTRCAAAVETTLRDLRGREFQSVDYDAARRSVAPVTDDEMAVKGEGRYRLKSGAASLFRYTCSFNPQTGATSGVVLREPKPPAAAAAAKAWQPDLAKLSPGDCQSAVADVLKQRHPRVANIVFDADARALEPAEHDATALIGRGAMQRAPGMNAVAFRYRCEFEPKRGAVVEAQAIE